MLKITAAVNERGQRMPVCNYDKRPHVFVEWMDRNGWVCERCGAFLEEVDAPRTESPRIRIESNGTPETTTVWLDGVNQDLKAIMFHASALEPEAIWKLELI